MLDLVTSYIGHLANINIMSYAGVSNFDIWYKGRLQSLK